ncbi:Putative homeodomain transcription factor [Frankliniella fusca]|uniref:Homeodomain transcription factor n=1 Tax=Frankliniella fusca TaxID=407009 RepID=A0AAE1GWD5_9NEOP|nr:Putative homeodomain transcription factor [Frankliniella fusca]
MGLQEVAIWYQRKIGTYDKQLWERTVEQRILHGLTHVPRKSAKLKTELIDVDLVRGSSFPKAKPKHGLITVARLGIQRLLFLPVYWHWWVQQTSPKAFVVLLILYLLQSFNVGLYIHYIHQHPEDITDNVSACEVLVPTFMMIILSIIHSQIVCTHNGQPPELHDRSRRRIKRTKRRTQLPSRIRSLNPDPKLPTTEAEKQTSLSEGNGKFNKRVNVRRKIDDSSRKCKLSDVEGNGEDPPKIRVCFKEPADDEISVEQEPVNNQAGREGTPLDDDGFESLNGNGSSENGDEAADEDIEPVNTSKIKKSAGKLSEMFLKCPDKCSLNVARNREDDVETNHKNTSCENVICDDNVPNVDEFETYKENPSTFRIIDKCKEQEKDLEKNSHGISDFDVSNMEGNSSIDWQGTTCKGSRRESDGGWSCEEVDKIMNRNHIIQRRQSAPLPRTCQSAHDTDSDGLSPNKEGEPLLKRRRGSQNLLLKCPAVTAEESSYNSSCCDESEEGGDERLSSPGPGGSGCENQNLTEGGTTSATDYMGVTTNSEECSYSSDMDESDSQAAPVELNDHPFAWEFEQSPTVILSPSCAASDKVSCTMWESRDVKKADLSVLDISSAIIERVEAMPDTMDYFYLGMILALLLSLVPPFCRLLLTSAVDVSLPSMHPDLNNKANSSVHIFYWNVTQIMEYISECSTVLINGAFGSSICERTIMIIALLERFALAELFFFLLAVAERSFKQRFLYAKLFSHLTSFRRARKSELPHFRLNKVRNIKTWLSVRSYLRKRGPQRSVDMLVSAAFIITLLLLTFLIVELLKVSWGGHGNTYYDGQIAVQSSNSSLKQSKKRALESVRLNSQYNMEALCWCLSLGLFLLRFMTLGTDINRKYCNLSVLITEQINLYLQIEQKPNKKEELMVANSVLKLAADLLKELESPFKISGLSANPYLYNITNVVILSALSGVLSEILGFKLKLHKIKIKRKGEQPNEKSTLLCIIIHHLRDEGYLDSARHIAKESGLGDQYEMCDNIDLPTIVKEFEDYYYVRFQKHPKLCKKSEQPGDGSTSFPPSKGHGRRKVFAKKASTTEAGPGQGDGAASAPEPLELTVLAYPLSQAGTGAGAGPEAADDVPPPERLLRPIAGLHKDPEWRNFAEIISRDIFMHNPNVRWSDIKGLREPKRLLREAVVYPVKYPELFSGILTPWKGLLLYGPSGTGRVRLPAASKRSRFPSLAGKTLLAKAVATECGTTFFNVSASTLVSKWRGDSEKLVRVLFELARLHAPSTVFLDEVDALASRRGLLGEHEASRRLQAELLVQLDGLNDLHDKHPVFLLVTSNLPWDLDEALLRRLEKRILVDLPDVEAREQILRHHLPPAPSTPPPRARAAAKPVLTCHLDYTQLAQETEGYSGADLRLVCKEAAMQALRGVFTHLDSGAPDCAALHLDAVTTASVRSALARTRPCGARNAERFRAWQQQFGAS